MPNTQKDREREHFDKMVTENGEVWWGHLTAAGPKRLERRIAIIKKYADQFTSAKMLEMGCGAGAKSNCIAKALPEVQLTCCDLSPASIELAKSRYSDFKNVTFEVGDVTQLPNASGT